MGSGPSLKLDRGPRHPDEGRESTTGGRKRSIGSAGGDAIEVTFRATYLAL